MSASCNLDKYNICIEEGTDYRLALSYYDDDGETPLDLTGITSSMYVKLFGDIFTYPGAVIGNSITYTVPHTEIFTSLCGEYQIDTTYPSGTVVRDLRGDVDIERKL